MLKSIPIVEETCMHVSYIPVTGISGVQMSFSNWQDAWDYVARYGIILKMQINHDGRWKDIHSSILRSPSGAYILFHLDQPSISSEPAPFTLEKVDSGYRFNTWKRGTLIRVQGAISKWEVGEVYRWIVIPGDRNYTPIDFNVARASEDKEFHLRVDDKGVGVSDGGWFTSIISPLFRQGIEMEGASLRIRLVASDDSGYYVPEIHDYFVRGYTAGASSSTYPIY